MVLLQFLELQFPYNTINTIEIYCNKLLAKTQEGITTVTFIKKTFYAPRVVLVPRGALLKSLPDVSSLGRDMT